MQTNPNLGPLHERREPTPDVNVCGCKNAARPGVLVQTNANLGRYTSAANPRQMSMSVRLQF